MQLLQYLFDHRTIFFLIEHLKELVLPGTDFESPGTGSSEVVGPGFVSWLWLGQIKLGYRVL